MIGGSNKHKSEYGNPFEKAINHITPQFTCCQDDSKLTLLYAQMHKLATEYPDADITFEFFESDFYVYEQLCGFFDNKDGLISTNRELNNYDLIPKNVTLTIDLSAPTLQRHSYIGTGKIDKYHQANIDRMIKCAGYSDTNTPDRRYPRQHWGFGIIPGLLNSEKLNAFKKDRNPYALTDLKNLQDYAQQQVKRLNHWYIWNGRAKAASITKELKAIDEYVKVNEGNAAIIDGSEVSTKLFGLFSALATHRYQFKCSKYKIAKARQDANRFAAPYINMIDEHAQKTRPFFIA